MENEILKLKMMAERGGYFSESAEYLPPEVEAEFLKNIQLFEDSFDNAEEISVYECIGKPEYKDVHELPSRRIKGRDKKITGTFTFKKHRA